MSIQNAESRGVKLQNSTLLGKEQQMQLKTYYLYWTTAPVARSSDQPINKRQSSNQQTHKQTRKKRHRTTCCRTTPYAIGRCNPLDPSPWLNRVSLHCFGSPKQWIWLDCISLRLSCSTPWNMEIQRKNKKKRNLASYCQRHAYT